MLRISQLNSLTRHCRSVALLASNYPKVLNGTIGGNQGPNRQFSYNAAVASVWKTISDSTPVAYLQDGLLILHDTTGLPWWSTIIASTVLLRMVVTFPFAVYQNKIQSRIELCTLEMPDIVKALKIETAYAIKKFKWTEKQARSAYNVSLRKQWNNMIIRENCHPAKTFILLWVQIPLWIFQSVAVRNLVLMLPNPNTIEAQVAFTELTMGGFLWVPNLTECDSSFIIPVTLGLVNLAIIEVQTMMRVRPPTKLQKYATNFFRVLSIGMIPIACQVPACLSLYWLTSSSVGLAQNVLLLSPVVRRKLGIPETPSELPDPYRHLQDSIKLRLSFKPPVAESTSSSPASSPTTTTTTDEKKSR